MDSQSTTVKMKISADFVPVLVIRNLGPPTFRIPIHFWQVTASTTSLGVANQTVAAEIGLEIDEG